MAFQAVDDLLGIWGEPDRTGKPVGSDLLLHKKSLPIVAALARGRRASGRAGRPARRRARVPAEVARATRLIEASGARGRGQALADAALRRRPGRPRPGDPGAGPRGRAGGHRPLRDRAGPVTTTVAARPARRSGARRPARRQPPGGRRRARGARPSPARASSTPRAGGRASSRPTCDRRRGPPAPPVPRDPDGRPRRPPPPRWIRAHQRDDGTWANFFGGPPELSTTVEAYVALRLAGRPGRRRAHGAGGRVHPRGRGHRGDPGVHPDLAGPVRAVAVGRPAGAPARAHVPAPVGPLNIYDFGCWARQTVVALTVVGTHRPVRDRPDHPRRADRAGRPPARRRPVARRPGTAASRARPPAAPLRAAAAPLAAPPRPGPGRALDRPAPGGRRLVGRHPAAVGVLADRPAPAGLRPRPPGHARPAWPGWTPSRDRRRADGASRPASRRSGTPPWPSSPWPTPGAAPDDPALAGRPPGCWARRSRCPATGACAGPTWPRAAGPSSSPTTATPTSTTRPRWLLALGRVGGRRQRLPRAGGGVDARACSAPTAAGPPSTSTTPSPLPRAPFCDFGELIDPPSADVTAHVVEMLACPGRRGRGPRAGCRLAARGPGGRRLVVRALGRQLRLRDRGGGAGPGGRGSRPRVTRR